MAKKKTASKFLWGVVAFVVGAVGCFFVANYVTLPLTDDVSISEEVFYSNGTTSSVGSVDEVKGYGADISIHFLELGNKYTGDCTLIQTPQADVLIDCGSKSNSIATVSNYLGQYVTDGTLEYVIVTHAHQDHYAGFATSENVDSIFDLYDCEVIIDFAQTNQKDTARTYQNYLRERDDEIANGAKHYTALDCVTGANGAQDTFEIGDGITLQILDSRYYYEEHKSEVDGENDFSVCCLVTQNLDNGQSKNFLFTGDLEEDGESYLVEMNDLPQVELYKAGHHGSKTSSSETLMAVVQPQIVCVCCCAGSSEYTDVDANQFPTQIFIDNIAPYTAQVYVTTLCVDYANDEFTSMNGNIVYLSKGEDETVMCSNNNTLLKDTQWFSEHRNMPQSWQNVA